MINPCFFSLIFVLITPADSTIRPVQNDDIFARMLMSVGTTHGKTVFITTNGRAQKTFLFFDHKTGKTFEIDDQRLNGISLLNVIPTKNGFVLADSISDRVFLLNRDCTFRTSRHLTRFTGIKNDIIMINSAPYREGQGLVSYKHYEEDMIYIGVADYENSAIELIYSFKPPEKGKMVSYLWNGHDYVSVNEHTSMIEIIDSSTFKSKSVLMHAEKPVRNPNLSGAESHWEEQIGYMTILGNSIIAGDHIILEKFNADKKGRIIKERDQVLIKGETIKIRNVQTYVFAKSDSFTLSFDPEEGQVLIERQ